MIFKAFCVSVSMALCSGVCNGQSNKGLVSKILEYSTQDLPIDSLKLLTLNFFPGYVNCEAVGVDRDSFLIFYFSRFADVIKHTLVYPDSAFKSLDSSLFRNDSIFRKYAYGNETVPMFRFRGQNYLMDFQKRIGRPIEVWRDDRIHPVAAYMVRDKFNHYLLVDWETPYSFTDQAYLYTVFIFDARYNLKSYFSVESNLSSATSFLNTNNDGNVDFVYFAHAKLIDGSAKVAYTYKLYSINSNFNVYRSLTGGRSPKSTLTIVQ